MKILITGATGFVGGRLTERLLEKASYDEVITTGRNQAAGKKLQSKGAKFFAGSLEDQAFAASLVSGVDVIVHSAGKTSPWGPYSDFVKANLLPTQYLLDAAMREGVKRFVQISTPSIYFNGEDRLNIREEDVPKKMTSFYAQTKLEAEELCLEAYRKGLEVIMLRPRGIIGRGDTTYMPRLLKAHAAGKLQIMGKGKNKMDFTPVSNVLDAIELSIEAPAAALGQAYNIANGDPVNMWDFIDQFLQTFGEKLNRKKIPYFLAYAVAGWMEMKARWSKDKAEPPMTRQAVGVVAKSCTLNIEKAQKLLGYQPAQSSEEAMLEFVDWWKKSS